MIDITFSNKVVQVEKDTTILQAVALAGRQVESTCGGKGTCGKCKVQIKTDAPYSPTLAEKKFLTASELEAGWVLACQHTLTHNASIRIEEQKDVVHRKTDLAELREIELAPSVCKYPLELERPTVEDQRSDWERLVSALPERGLRFSRSIAATLPKVLRDGGFQITAVLDGHRLLAVEPHDTSKRCFGIAIDIGTTTVVVYLLDMLQGIVAASGAMTNPQQIFGADVISRITYAAGGPEKLQEVQGKVVGGLNKIIKELCQEKNIKQEEIYQAVVVGNTTMAHLFLGIDPTYLAPAPFIPVFQQMVDVEAKELGLYMLSTGRVLVLPNVAGYVGSDTVGAMLAARADHLDGVSLIVDIGTNGEMVLSGKNRILTCSTAAGPAFEGAEIRYGMRAAEGAIEAVSIAQDVELKTIGGGKDRGICGSGLIDAIAEMFKAGVITASGRYASEPEDLEILPPLVRERLRKGEQTFEFVLAWGKDSVSGEDLVLSQKDIRALQLAKGAISAGITLLVREMGISPLEIDRVLLAGAFGNYIKKESALGIGLLPPLPLERIHSIGNAAGDGAKMALLSIIERGRAETMAKQAEHIELSNKKEFQDEFLKGLGFEGIF
ncbi:putative metal-binding protein [Desulfosporosinus acidiphilus SJ4]|uniref:Putative metal-binding protein n=1 Tax=Desulfosporosinus acidiphilus (strain DSM 22704 / JCM 16185 / SJ4) TaxID=646529 RepID=I4D366_DESAJ|nr:ASKHA domain-containing protein [Desulfosporosinus acidiphilus]AFM40240.1 putative metal-binding protein [Desulfosporosinus acidiphilus SJ4]